MIGDMILYLLIITTTLWSIVCVCVVVDDERGLLPAVYIKLKDITHFYDW